MLAEHDAKTRWCPYSPRDVDKYGASTSCIASECMAWRWKRNAKEVVTMKVGEGPPDNRKGWKSPTTTLSGRVVWERTEPPSKGYCGLAERPER